MSLIRNLHLSCVPTKHFDIHLRQCACRLYCILFYQNTLGVNTADCNDADGSGVDYFSLVDETVAFPITSTSQTVDIYIKNDTGNVDFTDETFCVNLDTTCTRGEVSDTFGSVTVTIRNDDSMYVVLSWAKH